MSDNSGLPTRLITLGMALVAFGLGCHYWEDRVYRIAALAVGVTQLCRYFLNVRIESRETGLTFENKTKWMKVCDHLTAVLLVMAIMHPITRSTT